LLVKPGKEFEKFLFHKWTGFSQRYLKIVESGERRVESGKKIENRRKSQEPRAKNQEE
jgi:hypothetical protein